MFSNKLPKPCVIEYTQPRLQGALLSRQKVRDTGFHGKRGAEKRRKRGRMAKLGRETLLPLLCFYYLLERVLLFEHVHQIFEREKKISPGPRLEYTILFTFLHFYCFHFLCNVDRFSPENLPRTDPGCNFVADIGFLIDASGSFREQYLAQLKFVEYVISR